MQGFLRNYGDMDLQTRFDVAVVIPTLLRPQLRVALHGIFRQRFIGRIQVLVGIDKPVGDLSVIDAACAARPPHCAVQVFWPGYSTAARHGGMTRAGDGGALRCVLTYLANAPFVAYLDDDNWWGPDHLAQLRGVTEQADWGFSLRWFVHPDTRRPAGVDIWESVGPGKGVFNEQFGGFVDPSCLMINKTKCPVAAPHWNFPLCRGDIGTADRAVFKFLASRHSWRGTGKPTAFYTMNPNDGRHDWRVRVLGAAYAKAGQPEMVSA
jgi:hypothetical protein